MIKDLKCGRHTSDIQKPEDIVNATIQSQTIDRKSHEDLVKHSMKKAPSDGKIAESKSETDDMNNEIKNGAQKGQWIISDSISWKTGGFQVTPETDCLSHLLRML